MARYTVPATDPPEEEWLTLKQAAAEFDVRLFDIRDAIRDDGFPYKRIDRRIHVSRSDMRRFK